jgi:hypothetical protein
MEDLISNNFMNSVSNKKKFTYFNVGFTVQLPDFWANLYISAPEC